MAVHADQPAGIVVGGPLEDTAGLFSLWVAPEARGQGLGAALVQAAIAWARGRGHDRLLLDVGDANRTAIALYAALGFEPTGRTGTLPPPRTHVREHQRVLALASGQPAPASTATPATNADRG